MKKYFSVILALLLAIGLSAFSVDRTKGKGKDGAKVYRFWYSYSGGYISNILGVPPGSEYMPKEDAASYTQCPLTIWPYTCAKAYAVIQNGLPKLAPPSSVDQIYKPVP